MGEAAGCAGAGGRAGVDPVDTSRVAAVAAIAGLTFSVVAAGSSLVVTARARVDSPGTF